MNKNELKTIGLSAAIAAVVTLVVVVGLRLVGDQLAYGAIGNNRYPNSGFSMRSVRVSTSTTPTAASDGALEVTGGVTFSQTLALTGALTGSSADFSGEVQGAVIDEGTLVTLTGAATSAMTAANACDGNVISYAPGAAGASTTLPASSSWISDCLDTNGDSVTFLFRNTTSSVASTTVKAGDASTTLFGLSASDDEIGNGQAALIKAWRTGTDTITALIIRLLDAD